MIQVIFKDKLFLHRLPNCLWKILNTFLTFFCNFQSHFMFWGQKKCSTASPPNVKIRACCQVAVIWLSVERRVHFHLRCRHLRGGRLFSSSFCSKLSSLFFLRNLPSYCQIFTPFTRFDHHLPIWHNLMLYFDGFFVKLHDKLGPLCTVDSRWTPWLASSCTE